MIIPPKKDGWLLQSDISPANDNTARHGDWMQTYTGRQFWPMDPRRAEIDIVDIAHSLAMQCRYAGHCIRFYSVAEHSVHVATWLQAQGEPRAVVLKGLLHDASEAYLVDVPRPVKPYLAGYKEAEARVWREVCHWAGMSDAMPEEVHYADNHILVDEMHQNMRQAPVPWSIPEMGIGVALQFWSPEQAEVEFLSMFDAITLKEAA